MRELVFSFIVGLSIVTSLILGISNTVAIKKVMDDYMRDMARVQEEAVLLNKSLDELIDLMRERREKDANNRSGKKRVGRNLFKLRSKALL